MRPFNGQREVLRRLQERNEARSRLVDGIREIGGLPPVEVAPFTAPFTRVVDLPLIPRQRNTNFTMQYMGAPMRVDMPTYHTDYDGDYLTQLLTRVGEHTPVIVQDDLWNDLQAQNRQLANGGGVGVNLQGLRDVETMRVRERFGVGVINAVAGRPNRNGRVYHTDTTIRGTTANRMYFEDPNWAELFGYNSNENSKQLLKKDWNTQGEFLEEERYKPVSLWNHATF
jgi:hypothetical protein